MINPITRWLIIGLVISAAAAIGLLSYQNQGLRGDNALITLERNTANAKVKAQQTVIATLETSANTNESSHARLIKQLGNTKNMLVRHEQTIRTLEQENEQLKMWSNTRLPDPVIRLRQRPALTGSAAYQDWLSARDAMPVTGEQPAK